MSDKGVAFSCSSYVETIVVDGRGGGFFFVVAGVCVDGLVASSDAF